MQRGHPEVPKNFSLNLEEIHIKVGAMEFEV